MQEQRDLEQVRPAGRVASLHRRGRQVLGGILGALLVATLLPVSAGAQVPGLPDTPDVPEPIPSTVQDAIQTLATELTSAAQQAGPAAEAVGFALRPVCAAAGVAFVVVVIGGGAAPVPFNVVPLANPMFVVCAFAFGEGPADPVFQQVDAAVGPTLEDAVAPALDQLGAALEPARPNLAEACGNLTLFGGVGDQFPPPANRFDYVGLVCG